MANSPKISAFTCEANIRWIAMDDLLKALNEKKQIAYWRNGEEILSEILNMVEQTEVQPQSV